MVEWLNIVFFQYISCTVKTKFSALHNVPFIYFNWRKINLQHCDDFCHILIWISHGFSCAPSILNPHSHLPPHPVPPGCHRILVLGTLYHISNLHWLSVLHMVMCMFNATLSNHPTLSSHRVQKSILYVCVTFAALNVGSSVSSF